MSILPQEIHTELAQLLQALQSADNGIRSQAEDHLQNNWTNTRPEILLMGLAEQIQGSQDAAVRIHRRANRGLVLTATFSTDKDFRSCYLPSDRF